MSSSASSNSTQTITNVVFGITATTISIVTIYQGHKVWKMWREYAHGQGNMAPDIELGLQSSHSTPTSLEVVEHEGISPPQLRRRTKLEKLNPTTCLCLYIRPSFSPLFQHQSRPRPPSAQPWSQGDGLIAMSLPEFTPRMHLPRQIWNAVLTPTSVSDLTRSQNHDGKSILPRLSPQVWDEGRDKLLEELSFVDIYME